MSFLLPLPPSLDGLPGDALTSLRGEPLGPFSAALPAPLPPQVQHVCQGGTAAWTIGWVLGGVPPFGRPYFESPVAGPPATYRVSVFSYESVALGVATLQMPCAHAHAGTPRLDVT